VVVLGLAMPEAVGTSLLVIGINAATALATRAATLAALDWPTLLSFTLAAIGAGVIAAHAITRVRPQRLVLTFMLLLVAVAFYTGVRSLPSLW
jgi:hypothetical protein